MPPGHTKRGAAAAAAKTTRATAAAEAAREAAGSLPASPGSEYEARSSEGSDSDGSPVPLSREQREEEQPAEHSGDGGADAGLGGGLPHVPPAHGLPAPGAAVGVQQQQQASMAASLPTCSC